MVPLHGTVGAHVEGGTMPTGPAEPIWAVATGGYRVEGGVRTGGRGASIWDRFAHTPGRTPDGATGDVASDQLNRFDQDVALAAELGVAAVRLSVAWPRIFPDGHGRPNRAGLDLYDRRVDTLLASGLEPWICPFHWDLPQALQELGGWSERDTVYRFSDYVATLFERLGDRVGRAILIHETNRFAHLGHLQGVHAPGLRDPVAFWAVVHHLNLATRLGAERLREMGEWPLVASLRWWPLRPAEDERDEDIEMLDRVRALWQGAFLDPLVDRSYPPEVEPLVEASVRDGDLLRGPPLDALEVSLGPTLSVRADPGSPHGAVVEPLRRAHDAEAEAIRDLLVGLSARLDAWGLIAAIEGGAAADVVDPQGAIDDGARLDALASKLEGIEASVAAGARLDAVVVAPLLDGFDWSDGYRRPRGLVHVDRETLRRTPKASFRWLAEAVREG
jgi:beta-glucosidase